MPRARILSSLRWAASLAWAMASPTSTSAQTVWSGLTLEFSKAAFADPASAEGQDRITDNVWLTRAVQRGLFNASQESAYVDNVSPVDTEWATDLMPTNAGETIAATNWDDLDFTDWIGAYGGMGSQDLPFRLTSRNAVVHLITDDVYLDLQFTSWNIAGGGAFSYLRAEGELPPPPPTTTGDYNQNGVVDAADYVLWRKTLNETVAMPGDGADGDRSGTIDAGDYDFWRGRFGNIVTTSTGSSRSAAVPEASTLASLLIALLVLTLVAPPAFQPFAHQQRHNH